MPTRLDTVMLMINDMGAKNYDRAPDYFTADCEYTNMPLGTATGPAGVRTVLEPFFAPTITNEFQLIRAAVNDACVFVERLDRHLIESGWVELPVVGVFEFQGDKISIWRDYFDIATLVRQWPALAAMMG